MGKQIRIGTRNSQLAQWQANQVKNLLERNGFKTEIIAIKSTGDLNLSKPLYSFGVEGVFTKNLDAALLDGKIDIAVHSMKDVPTTLAEGLSQIAVLKRGPVKDLLLYKTFSSFEKGGRYTIATGSVRRKAQWLNRYPNSLITGLRGNVNTRLKKLEENNWDGALFAAAGLERIGLRPEKAKELDWMLPAPAQGAIMVTCRTADKEIQEIRHILNDKTTALCTKIERDFLQALYGGCSTPISASAQFREDQIYLHGNILTPEGQKKVEIQKSSDVADADNLGYSAGKELLKNGGQEIVDALKLKAN